MQLPRMLSRTSCLALALVLSACEGAPPAQTSSGSRGAAGEVPPVTTANASATTPVRSDVSPSPTEAATADSSVSADELAADVRNANGFTLKVLARTKTPGENALVSGTSLRDAVGIAYLGARGETAREIASALSLADDPKIAARLARAEREAWQQARGSAELNVADRLWVAREFALQPDFVATADRAYGAAPETVDYGKPEDARKTINAWVSEKTKDKIPELLPQGSLDPRTRLVITDAIWFKAAWQLPFPKSATKDAPFKLDAKKTVTVPMMHLTDSFRVATLPGLKVLELRYAKTSMAMLVALPDDPAGLAKLDAGPDTLKTWTDALGTARVNVTLPRFTFRSGGVMNAALQDLGMKLAFTDRADFGGIAAPRSGERLEVNQVVHQTWIAVDELGTEAAAATGLTMRTTGMLTGPVVEFKADHPFLFVIQDTAQGRILFAGRVANPK